MAQKRKIDDAGEKIGGARKDWNKRHLNAADLDEMTDAEIVTEVTKDSVWPKPDFEKLVKEGMPEQVAALVKIMRDRLPKTPCPSRHPTEQERRKAFAEIIGEVRDRAMAARVTDDLDEIGRDIINRLNEEVRARQSERPDAGRMQTLLRGRTNPLYLSRTERLKAAEMVAAGFPQVLPSWLKGVKFLPDGDGMIRVVKAGRFVAERFKSREAAGEWLKAQADARKNNPLKETRKQVPTRPHLDRLVRSGLNDHRDGADITPDTFIETFGFRGIEFGEWLPDDERQQVLNRGYDALIDLADALNWEPRQVSLDGTLAVAFGARGRGGKAAAHYEPGRKVINMTRLSGAGSLAHEFGHALDHYLGEGTTVPVPGGIPSASGWRNNISRQEINDILGHHGEEIASAWADVVQSMLVSPRKVSDELDRVVEVVASNQKVIDDQVNALEAWKAKGNSGGTYERKVNQWLADANRRQGDLQKRLASLQERDGNDVIGTRESDFLKNAIRITGKNGYWAERCELLARSFEAYVFDVIAERGGQSDYLVHSVTNDSYDPTKTKGKPYPEGDERVRLFEHYRKAVELTRLVIPCAPEISPRLSA